MARTTRRSRPPSRRGAGAIAALLGAVAIATASAPGCVGTSIGNPPGVAQAEIQLGVQGVAAGAVARSGGGGEDSHGVAFDEVWLAVGAASLAPATTCDAGAAALVPGDVGPFAAELVSGRVVPDRPGWSRPGDESYCRLHARLDGASPPVPGAPAELAGVTVLARGRRADGVPFEARVAVPLDLARGPSSGAFSLGAGLVGMVLVFDYDDWFDPDLLDAATVEGGRVIVDATHNPEVAEAIAEEVPRSARLFRDDDHDGWHDEDEAHGLDD